MRQRIAVVTYSTADLPEDLRAAVGITVVPLDVRFGDESFRDGVDLTNDAFMERLARVKLSPGTSQPSPARFEEVFRALAVDHDAIVAVLLSAKLSGMLNSAAVATAAVAPLVPIELVDSRSGSVALGFQGLRAAELAAGTDAPAIAEALRAEVQRHQVVFFVYTLEYLQPGGRIGRAVALISGMLQLKPMLRIDEGQVVPWERTRTRSRALAGQIDVARGLPAIERVAALYSSDRTEGIAFADRIASELSLPREQVVVAQIGPTVATRIGPGAMGIAVVEAVP
ncbi:MAG: hypothetical protein AVDCRST_MAG59-2447 [uncultured Thermomicrobiales bacterium]|uniref:DegV family protein n=1 Tax=uncultured Thermomicrobiales bacterium TaxID=1645740 RepID=A0A6J4UT61_9BACT|nr:MAG: hypothetical protein AVDCRST_MAG59-2447 [uncultured Thermomicrobiales bacterium]